jgi:hypothetical protein
MPLQGDGLDDSSSSSSAEGLDLRPLLQLLQLAAHTSRTTLRHHNHQQQQQQQQQHHHPQPLLLRLQDLAAAAAPTCTPPQLIQLMTAWNQLGFSSAWQHGGLRRGYRRLSNPGVLQGLSNDELAAAVVAAGKLPPLQRVVQGLAGELNRRLLQQQQQQQGLDADSAATAAAAAEHATEQLLQQPAAAAWFQQGSGPNPEPQQQQQQQCFTSSHLVDMLGALPSLVTYWPPEQSLSLLQSVQGLVTAGALNPAEQWQVWSALQQLQGHWVPSVAAAAAVHSPGAAAAAAVAAAGSYSDGDVTSEDEQEELDRRHDDGLFAAAAVNQAESSAAAAATVSIDDEDHCAVPQAAPAVVVAVDTAAAAAAAVAGSGVQQLLRPPPRSSSSSSSGWAETSSQQQQQQQQQAALSLLQVLQQQVADSLSHASPQALPISAAPIKITKVRRGGTSGKRARAAAVPADWLEEQQQQQQQEGRHTMQQLLQHFAKARRALLNPRCGPAGLGRVCEGLGRLLAVPRFSGAADKAPMAARGVLRALEACAWPEVLAGSLDGQQLLLLLRAVQGLGARLDGPYMQTLAQTAVQTLTALPGRELAAVLGKTAAASPPGFSSSWQLVLLRVWVGRVQQLQPEEAVACFVPLVKLGFRPAPGAAALVLRPAVAAAAAAAAGDISSSSGSKADGEAPSQQQQQLSPTGLLLLTRALADLGLRPEPCLAKELLAAHVTHMRSYNVTQLLQLGRSSLQLGLLGGPSNGLGVWDQRQQQHGGSSSRDEGMGSDQEDVTNVTNVWQGVGFWVRAWLAQLQFRGVKQMSSSQVRRRASCCSSVLRVLGLKFPVVID